MHNSELQESLQESQRIPVSLWIMENPPRQVGWWGVAGLDEGEFNRLGEGGTGL